MDARKRGRHESGGNNTNGGFKRSRQESDSGVGSKLKPCTKFFSTNGCPFGESCHFLHYVPGGHNAAAQLMNRSSVPQMPRTVPAPPPASYNSPSPSVKNRMCNKYNTVEGCKFGDKCHYAHGEWELGRPVTAPHHEDPRMMGGGPPPMPGRMRMEAHHQHQPGPVPGFGDTTTTKISVDASLAGSIIGKGGVNSKQICRQTGAKLSIRDHESDPNLRNIELDGTLEQVGRASAMVRELLANIGPPGSQGGRGSSGATGGDKQHPGSNYKTKICERFMNGSCSFGERCHFAHGAAEMRKSGPGM
ncbi:Zinc finger CCCH domain-containing protein 44 [Linum grandiflorum]